MVAATGKWRQNPFRKLSMLTSSIITTNKNNTITAPTYTNTKVMDKNSALSSIQRPDAWKNANTKYKAACTVLLAVMTRKAANSMTTENR